MKHRKAALTILVALLASIAVADDFKTINGKEYKNATVSRVEPDGIVLKTKGGISKVYFTELPKEVQERFNYNPEKAAVYSAEQNAVLRQAQKQHKRPRTGRKRQSSILWKRPGRKTQSCALRENVRLRSRMDKSSLG